MRGRLSHVLWLLFALFVVYGSLIPFNFTVDRTFVAAKWAHVPFSPWISPETGRRVSFPDVIQNILLFVPFGALGVLARGRAARFAVGRIVFVIGLGLVLSISVEAMQLFTHDRVASTSDVAAQAIGCLAGALVAQASWHLSLAAIRRVANAGWTDTATFYPLLVLGGVVVVAALEPFDVTLDVGSFMTKARSLAHDVWQSGVWSDEGIAVVQYALLAMALANWLLSNRRSTRAAETGGAVAAMGGWERMGVAIRTVAATGTLALALEAVQMFLFSRMPGLEDALVRAAGAVLGALVWLIVDTRRSCRSGLAVLTAATAAGAAMQQWSPFTLAPAPRPFQWFPFLAAYVRTRFETLSHDIELVLTYLPLAFCLVWFSTRGPRRWVAPVAITLLIAVPIEYGQRWILGRYPDVTDVTWSLAGAWCGIWAARAGASLFDRTVRQAHD